MTEHGSLLDQVLGGVWLSLAAVALAGRGEVINSLTLHGKLRLSSPTQVAVGKGREWVEMLREVTVPKHWFWHFYLVALAVAVALLDGRPSLVGLLFLVHVLRRLGEQLLLFPRRRSRMHLLAYCLGLGFYPLYGLSLWAGAAAAGGAAAAAAGGGGGGGGAAGGGGGG